jgi:tetratricopeptide (TPR) repeat protein
MSFSNRPIPNRWQKLGMVLLVCTALLATMAQAQDDDDDRRQQSLNPAVAQDLLSAYELIEADDHAAALQELNELLDRRGEDMKPFDRASVLQIRGTAYVNLDDYDLALRDFEEAIAQRALPTDQENRLRFNMAQLNFVLERYADAIELFETWMAQGDVEITDTTYFMLAAAHYNLEEYREAISPIQSAIELSEEPEKRYYDLNNVIFSNLEMGAERTRLLETMVTIWPTELTYWRQLTALYLDQGEEMKSFGALETAYVGGLIESGDDIILLAQYYSTYENPHRGAQLIEKEMEAGRIERSVDNLELLSQLWSQAREHRKAIPVLQEAAQLADTGMLSYRLGQAFLADEQNERAEEAFEAAIDKGGLSDSTLAEAWMLLGNARFNQAGPGDRDQRMLADQAFARATNYSETRAQASDWRQYISAINRTESRQAILEQEQADRLASAAEERLLTSCRAQQLAGQTLTEQCRRLLEADDG